MAVAVGTTSERNVSIEISRAVAEGLATAFVDKRASRVPFITFLAERSAKITLLIDMSSRCA